jgi:signal transduction histidine kinase
MHKRLIAEGFNRRYVLVPMLLAIALVLLGFWVTETRRNQARELVDVLRERQEVMRLAAESIYKTLEAESAQRGYMLTGEGLYLEPMEEGLDEARARLRELMTRYEQLEPDEVPVLQRVEQDLEVKAGEMQASVRMVHEGQRQLALDIVKLDLGLYRMQAISAALSSLREREYDRLQQGLREWEDATRLNTVINVSSVVFTTLLLLILGLLASRDIRRREGFAAQLATQIDARTAALRDLSRHMSRVAETEKHALARELHDELGGLLVAMRIDLVQLRKRIGPSTDPDILARWERVEQALAQGLELKRRVIEDLRPTLLDNMGLFTALRWLAQQRAEQANLELQMEGLDEDIEVPAETAIAVFRTVQEAIANIVKHSGARQFAVRAVASDQLVIEVSDDGRGLPEGAEQRTGSHGLKQMRFRMEAVGGELEVGPRDPHGTLIVLSVALAGAVPAISPAQAPA